jgi:hypothetical protein
MQIVAQYPQSLKDIIGGVIIGPGHCSLITRLVSRVENINWSSCVSSVRQKRTIANNTKNEDVKELRSIDAYGCAR